jgi:geranylgeranyl reductase family protein
VRDVAVIGAGPAGCIAAEHLAAAGHDVVILEEHDGVGAPVHCTGLVGVETMTEFSLPHDLVLTRTGRARFVGTAGQSFSVASERTQAVVLDREQLDQTLARRAVAAGAELRLGARVDDVTRGATGVQLRVRGESQPLSARACVLACGASYRWHEGLGLSRPTVFLQSAQAETAFPDLTASGIEVRFGRAVAPAGFAWMVPFRRGTQPHARVGLMAESAGADRFRTFAGALCDRAGFPADRIPAPRLKVLPLAPIASTVADRVLAVGDAAGLVKPTTGGGIYYGMVSGRLAARCLDEALRADRLGRATLGAYERAWRKRLGGEIRAGLAFRRIASRLSDRSIDALVDLARVDGVVPLLEQTASFNWHRQAAVALLRHPAIRRIVLRAKPA